jgi:hypothetical protein
VLVKRSGILIGLLSLTLPLAACANGSFGEILGRSLAPDERLANNPALFGQDGNANVSSECAAEILAQLPDDFPTMLCYPNAELVEVDAADPARPSSSSSDADTEPSDTASPTTETRSIETRTASQTPSETDTLWATADAAEQVRQFYQQLLTQQQWELTQPSAASSSSATAPLEAVKDGVRVRVRFNASASRATAGSPDSAAPSESETNPDANEAPASDSQTQFELQLAIARPSSNQNVVEQSSDPSFDPSPLASDLDSGAIASAQSFSDLDRASDDLRPYIEDLAALGVLTPSSSANSEGSSGSTFNPSQTVTRREFARWLFNANNTLFKEQPAKRIRRATADDQSAFQDISRNNPDFEIIQGLAEAGLIPSTLSGDSTTVNFRPDAPLTREDLVRWKVPLDVRRSLPTATVDAVQQTWGFQDAPRINPNALKAILADYQNGDLSNIRRAFGYTTLLQPQKPVTRAEAAAALWYFGYQGEGVSAQDILQSDRQSNNSEQ